MYITFLPGYVYNMCGYVCVHIYLIFMNILEICIEDLRMY